MERQRDPEVDVEAHALVQYVIMRANMAVALLTTVFFDPRVFSSLSGEDKVRLINGVAKTIPPERVRMGFELVRSKQERDPERERMIFEAQNRPGRRYEDYQKILAYILGNFDLIVQQVGQLGDMTFEQMVSGEILHGDSRGMC